MEIAQRSHCSCVAVATTALTSCAGGRHNMPPPLWPWPLTFWSWTWCPSHVWRLTWVTSVPILVFLGLSVLDLGPMYETDVGRQTSDVRQHHRLMPRPRRQGHNKTAHSSPTQFLISDLELWPPKPTGTARVPQICHLYQISLAYLQSLSYRTDRATDRRFSRSLSLSHDRIAAASTSVHNVYIIDNCGVDQWLTLHGQWKWVQLAYVWAWCIVSWQGRSQGWPKPPPIPS